MYNRSKWVQMNQCFTFTLRIIVILPKNVFYKKKLNICNLFIVPQYITFYVLIIFE